MDKEEQLPIKPKKGAWANLTNEKSQSVKFEINVPVIVEFKTDEPLEKDSQYGDDSVYYEFEVIANGTDSVIQTGAWTLLRELKAYVPLKGKKFTITKRLNKGKQEFEVRE